MDSNKSCGKKRSRSSTTESDNIKIKYTVDLKTQEMIPITYEIENTTQGKWTCWTRDPSLYFPDSWRGLCGDQLADKTGVIGSIFCYDNGNEIVCDSKRCVMQVLSTVLLERVVNAADASKTQDTRPSDKKKQKTLESAAPKIEEID